MPTLDLKSLASISCNIETIIPATGTPDVLKEYGIPVCSLSPIC